MTTFLLVIPVALLLAAVILAGHTSRRMPRCPRCGERVSEPQIVRHWINCGGAR